MARQRMELTFPPEMISQPLIYTMGKQFQVVTNIRRANVSGDRGWMVLEISGSDQEVENALTWAKSQGVQMKEVSETEDTASPQ